MKLHLRIRQNTNPKHNGACDVWLIQTNGMCESGVMWGVVSEDTANELAETLGIPVVREEQPAMVSDSAVEDHLEATGKMKSHF